MSRKMKREKRLGKATLTLWAETPRQRIPAPLLSRATVNGGESFRLSGNQACYPVLITDSKALSIRKQPTGW
jgi:hypothetical protein